MIYPHKQKLIECLNNCSGKIILDYGCGWGDFLELLINNHDKPTTIIAVDSDSSMIDEIHKRFPNEIKYGLIKPIIASTPRNDGLRSTYYLPVNGYNNSCLVLSHQV